MVQSYDGLLPRGAKVCFPIFESGLCPVGQKFAYRFYVNMLILCPVVQRFAYLSPHGAKF
jgi:hypothetical protein